MVFVELVKALVCDSTFNGKRVKRIDKLSYSKRCETRSDYGHQERTKCAELSSELVMAVKCQVYLAPIHIEACTFVSDLSRL